MEDFGILWDQAWMFTALNCWKKMYHKKDIFQSINLLVATPLPFKS